MRGDTCFFSHSIQGSWSDKTDKVVRAGDELHEKQEKRQKFTTETFESVQASVVKTAEPFASMFRPASIVKQQQQLLTPQHEPAVPTKPNSTINSESIASSTDMHPLAAKPFLPTLAPLLKSSIDSKVSKSHRQKVVDNIYKQFRRIYLPLLTEHAHLAHQHALEQEHKIHQTASKKTYTTVSVGVMSRLKERDVAVSIKDTGIDGEYQPRRTELTRASIEGFLITQDVLIDNGYPYSGLLSFPYHLKTERECDRCDKLFSDATCLFHSGYVMQQRSDVSETNERIYSCCLEKVPAKGCVTSKHVFKIDELSALHNTTPFQPTPEHNSKAHDIIALDCEMVYTTSGFEMARLCVVDVSGELLIDVLCKTKGDVIDLNTTYSGITSLDSAMHTLESARECLFGLVNAETIIVGHGLENDLKVMRIIHSKIVDTAILFTNPRGPSYKYALRNLAKIYLGKFIQTSLEGHSPLEDASTCIDLLHARIGKGFKEHKSKV